MTEIHKIMLQDACTKDVFREMDGFLVLMSVLSTIHPTLSKETREEVASSELLEATRLVFVILSEALHKHNENAEYFKVRVTSACTCRARSFVPPRLPSDLSLLLKLLLRLSRMLALSSRLSVSWHA